MCFTQNFTGFMMALNLGTGLFLQMRGNTWKRTQIFYTFFFMEFLQWLQYFVLGDCDHWLNQLTTVLSYIHICFQPLAVNIFLFRLEPNRDLTRTIVRLCLIGGFLGMMRLPYLGLAYLPAAVKEWVPGLPDLELAGTPTVCAWETNCGPRTCTFAGQMHLAWSLPLLPPSYFTPSGFIHFLLFFGPALAVPSIWSYERVVFVIFMALSGPFLTQRLAYKAAGSPAFRLEWSSTWCLFAIVQILLGLLTETTLGMHDDIMEPGRGGWRRFRKMVRNGRLFGGMPDVLKGRDGWVSSPARPAARAAGGKAAANGNGVAHVVANGNGDYANGNGVHANGNGVYANGNGVHTNGNGVHANGNGVHANDSEVNSDDAMPRDVRRRATAINGRPKKA